MAKYEITVASGAGFCFGVKRAANIVEKLIEKRNAGDESIGEIYTLGKLIHNKTYTDRLADLGVKTAGEADIPILKAKAASGDRITLVVIAHGITREIEASVKDTPNITLADGTCPCVKSIQHLACDFTSTEKYAKGKRLFVLFGDKDHPEVQSVISYAENGLVVSGADAFTALCENGTINIKDTELTVAAAAQTTLNCFEWKKTQKILQNLCTNHIIFDTICSVTELRQKEAVSLAKKCDIMIVIGGADSSNTAKLFDLCKSVRPRSYRIETAADLPEFGNGNIKIGITAGASTPDYVIGEITQAIKLEEENNE